MAIGTPYNLGGVAQASGGTTTAVTATQVSAAGDLLLVALGTAAAAVTATAVADDKPHTPYRSVGAYSAPSGQSCYLYVFENASALTTSNIITGTWSGTAQTKNMRAFGCSGLATSSSDDSAALATASGSGATASVTSGTLAQSNELVVAVCTCGTAGTSITWPAGWTEIGSDLKSGGGGITSVAVQVVSSNSPVSVSATLGATASWAIMVVPFKSTSAGGLAITTTTLAAGTVGTPYADTLLASGGSPPYVFDLTVGTVPAGLTLTAGSPGGGTVDPITYVAANGGPDGTAGQSIGDWNTAWTTIGPLTGIKTFYSADLPSTWVGSLAEAATLSHPGCVPVICWNGPGGGITPSAPATVTTFCNTIPAGQVVGFAWQQEPENPTSGISAAQFTAGFQSIARAIHALGKPNLLTVHCATWGQYMPTGRAFDGSFLPAGVDCDIYAMDIYQHQAGGSLNGATAWPSNGLANHSGFQRWLTLAKPLAAPLGRQFAITEYGIDDTGTLAARNARLQLDYNYIKTAFNGGAASPYPLWMFLYWWHSMAGSNTHYKFTDAATIATYKGIAAGSSSGGAGSTGGQITGTPTTAATSNFTARVTDALSATATHAESIVISASGALAVTTATVPGGTLNGTYTAQLAASGGTLPYTWSLFSGSLPTGTSLSAAGVISGTPTAAGTYNFTVRVTDNVAATANQALTIIVSAALTVTTTSLPSGQVAQVYTATLASSGGTPPYSWGLAGGTLPAGLVLDPDLATISGTPTIAGAYPITLQVTDSGGAGASDTQPITLVVNPASGGVPDIGRRKFGGGSSDWVGTFAGDAWQRSPNATVMFFTSLTGGTQYTGLLTTGGAAADTVTADGFGEIGEFYGPTGVWRMAMDANGGTGPRRWIYASDMGDELTALHSALTSGVFGPPVVGGGTTGPLIPSGDVSGAVDTFAIQGALTSAAPGTVVQLGPGTFYYSATLTIPDGVGLVGLGGESYGVPLGNYGAGGLNLQGTILQATSSFASPNSGTGLIFMRRASGQGGGQRIENISIDGSQLPNGNNLHGILIQDNTACVTLLNVNVYGSGAKQIGGDGLRCVSTGGSPPDLLNIANCHFSGCAGYGATLNGSADTYVSFTEATGNGTGGWNIINGNNARFTSCKGETSTGTAAPGWLFTANTGFTGVLHLSNCTAQSNNGSGFKFTGTGTGTYQLVSCSSDDDGRNGGAGGGGYAGLECTSFSGFVLATGFNVRLGAIPSPQYGISATSHNVLAMDCGVISGVTAPLFEGGGNATIVLGSGVVQNNVTPGGVFGTGADGAVTFNGTTTYAGFSTTTGSAPNLVYTLTRDVQAASIIVSSGITVKTGNFRIYCQGSCSNNGTLSNAGNNAAGSTAGAASSAALTGGRAGGAGGTGVSGAGANGTAANFGTAGGNGGAGTSGAAGTGGAATNTGTVAQNNLLQNPWPLLTNAVNYNNTGFSIGFGAGGGGGGSDASSNAGGGGGGGGGVVAIFAGAFTNSATGTVTAAGGNGGNGAAGNAGGGGGGAGGLIAVYTRTPWLQAGTVTVAGGVKGTHVGTGSDGVNGGAGVSFNVVVA